LNDTNRIGGIFTTVNDWTAIMGNLTSCPEIASLPLWYGDEDQSPDEPNYQQIGGWEVGAIKQYSRAEVVCNMTINKDVIYYAPTSGSLAKLALSTLSIMGAMIFAYI
jgi:hypothetical protein